jgi:hypothetical protein
MHRWDNDAGLPVEPYGEAVDSVVVGRPCGDVIKAAIVELALRHECLCLHLEQGGQTLARADSQAAIQYRRAQCASN